jgi:NADH-ubiquinone oxidoreductase chain 5
MEGPTPVSSLIHAATMVTAGIFLLIRCSFLFEIVPTICLLILFFGSLTTFLGATIGLFQYDIKKIIAYSTCSQLGYMFLSCGLMGFANSFFHLMNHAFFKALLFLAAGLLIHSFSHEQDYRKMGSLIFFLPFCYICILIGSLSLIGFPFFSGFYSKEGILHLFFNL